MFGGRSVRILVIGCGSIGRRHIRLLREMGVEVAGVDPDTTIDWVKEPYAVTQHTNLSYALLRGPWDGVIVATPPHLHCLPATQALKSGLAVLLEKPLAATQEDAAVILATALVNVRPVFVGYNLRFHPGLRRVKELLESGAVGTPRCARIHFGSYLPDWRMGADYRQGYAAHRSTGGGVILDASHELDYACWLFGEPVAVSCVATNTGALEIETEDVADIVVTFASGMQAAIHLDYLNRRRERGCEIVGDAGSIVWNFDPAITEQYNVSGGYAKHKEVVEIESRTKWAPYCLWEPDDMYRAELRHFLACLRGEEQPLCTGEDGLRALRLALAARESAETGKAVRL